MEFPKKLSRRRRLGAAVLIPLAMLLSACGMKYDFTVNSDDTAEMSILVWDSSGTLDESTCSSDGLDSTAGFPSDAKVSATFTSYQGDPACKLTVSGFKISDLGSSGDESSPQITHTDGKYQFSMPLNYFSETEDSSLVGDMEISVSVTFPGKVTAASGNGKIAGNTVTWSDITSENASLNAVADEGGSSSSTLWIVIVVIVVVIVVAVVCVVVTRKRKQKASTANPYALPGEQIGYPAPLADAPTGAPAPDGSAPGSAVPGDPGAAPADTVPGAPAAPTNATGTTPAPSAPAETAPSHDSAAPAPASAPSHLASPPSEVGTTAPQEPSAPAAPAAPAAAADTASAEAPAAPEPQAPSAPQQADSDNNSL